MQRDLPDHCILIADQYTAADNVLPTESELYVEEAVIVLIHDPDKTSDGDQPAVQCSASAPSSVTHLRNIIDKLHYVQEEWMSRNNLENIKDVLWTLS